MQILGAMVIAIGALFGIWLGAYYAAGRLGAQLDRQAQWFAERRDEEARWLEIQLQAEANRLERQLEHDRRMRDRDELRRMLDEAIAAMGTAHLGVTQVLASAGVFYLINEAIHEHLVEPDGPTDRDAALSAAWGMGTQHRRLRLRLGDGHELCRQYWKVRTKFLELLSDPRPGNEELPDEEMAALKAEAFEMRTATGDFVRMAAAHLDTQAQAQASADTQG